MSFPAGLDLFVVHETLAEGAERARCENDIEPRAGLGRRGGVIALIGSAADVLAGSATVGNVILV